MAMMKPSELAQSRDELLSTEERRAMKVAAAACAVVVNRPMTLVHDR